jgi:cytosine/adenosine deaminase-related metal-dependent hydrolase
MRTTLLPPAWLLRVAVAVGAVLACIAQQRPIAIGGTIVRPEGSPAKGWVVIQNGRILRTTTEPPGDGVQERLDTDLIIFPGFLDLHNHPMYAVFPRWTPARKFNNRYEWRGDPEYKRLISTPGSELQADDETFCDMDEFAEVQAILGGTTAITGISARRPPKAPVPNCMSGFVRNLDWASQFYGNDIGRERVQNVLGVTPGDLSKSANEEIAAKLKNGALDALLLHLAEGLPTDTESTTEFRALKGTGLLTRNTALIHGTGMSREQFREAREAGAAIIWSPRSNLTLYGATTDVISAFREGVSLALAPDWAPTGSFNMFDELRFAARFNDEMLGHFFSYRQLFEMATSVPARIAAIDDRVGSIQPGNLADIFLVRGDSTDPYTALVHAKIEDVQLVMIGGIAMYGTPDLMAKLRLKTENLKVCDTTRQLNADALPHGPLSGAEERLRKLLTQPKYKLQLNAIADCVTDRSAVRQQ